MNEVFQNGTLISFSSIGNSYKGFIVGTCSYDNAGEDNAYVVRYVFPEDGESPRKPYTIVEMRLASAVVDFPDNFFVAGNWSASPVDRCPAWKLNREGKYLFVVPDMSGL
jgi:hypothetical protein